MSEKIWRIHNKYTQRNTLVDESGLILFTSDHYTKHSMPVDEEKEFACGTTVKRIE